MCVYQIVTPMGEKKIFKDHCVLPLTQMHYFFSFLTFENFLMFEYNLVVPEFTR